MLAQFETLNALLQTPLFLPRIFRQAGRAF